MPSLDKLDSSSGKSFYEIKDRKVVFNNKTYEIKLCNGNNALKLNEESLSEIIHKIKTLLEENETFVCIGEGLESLVLDKQGLGNKYNNLLPLTKRATYSKKFFEIENKIKEIIHSQNVTLRIHLTSTADKNRKIISQNEFQSLMSEISILKHHSKDKSIKVAYILKERGFSTVFDGIDLTIINNLRYLDFSNIYFKDCGFCVNMSYCWFNNSYFENCDLSHIVLESSQITNAYFRDCNLKEAVFDRSTIVDSNFDNCNLQYSNFVESKMHKVNFCKDKHTNVEMTGANFTSATISECSIENYATNEILHNNKIKTDNANELPRKKPFVAIMWNNSRPGITIPKLYEALMNEFIPAKFNYALEDIDVNALDAEVEALLSELKTTDDPYLKKLPIPQGFIQLAKTKNPEEYPNVVRILERGKSIASAVECIALPGGEDVEPEFFNQQRIKGIHYPGPNYIRSLLEFAVLNYAQTLGVPTLGVCRGAQMINVWHGGTLKKVKGQLKQMQSLKINRSQGLIAGALGHSVKALSWHNHAIDQLSPDLMEVIKYDDIYKASENKHGSPVVLTQFHPEFGANYKIDIRSTCMNTFWSHLADAGNAYRKSKAISSMAAELKTQAKEVISQKSSKVKPTVHKFVKKPKSVWQKMEIGETVNTVIEFASGFFKYIYEAFAINHSYFQKTEPVKYWNLLKGAENINETQYAWYLNFALLNNAYQNASDPALKARIRFLIANYLDKAAPDSIKTLREYYPQIDELVQLSVFDDCHRYHRASFVNKIDIGAPLNKNLGLRDRAPLILTDNTDLDHLLPIQFQTISKNENSWDNEIFNALKAHFEKFSDPNKALKKSLEKTLLFDLTERFANSIHTNGDKLKEGQFESEYAEFQKQVNKSIYISIKKLKAEFSSLTWIDKSDLANFLIKNICFISRVDIQNKNEKIGGIKVFPVLTDLSGRSIIQKQKTLIEFINHTGIYIGAVNARKHLFDPFKFGKDIQYAVEGDNISYFRRRKDFTSMNLFKRLSAQFVSKEFTESHPQCAILGHATMQLLEGFFKEISDKDWNNLNADPVTRELLSNVLMNIANRLATADLHKDDFKQFALSLELIHSDLSILLGLTMPFKENDFEKTFLPKLSFIPENLKAHTTGGLTRTGSNTFAGIYGTLLSANPQLSVVRGNGFYYEQASILKCKTFEDAIKDPDIKKIDLYACQFNPSFEVDSKITGYKVNTIADDIKKIFSTKPETKQLTVVVDTTIDYINSEKNQMLLKEFEKEILEGKLNIIFTKSGQKFDQFGMDIYYGAPYFMINNGESHWKSTNSLFSREAHKIDSLSLQWFNLTYKYAADSLEEYRKAIFHNTREILDTCSKKLFTDQSKPQRISISHVDDGIDPSYIDLKIRGYNHAEMGRSIQKQFYKYMLKQGIKVNRKASFGFYHANLMKASENNCSSIRINPGIDPKENAIIVKFLNKPVN